MQLGTKYVLKWKRDALALTTIALTITLLLSSLKHATEAQAILSPLPSGVEYREVKVYTEPETVEDKIIAEFGDDAEIMLRVAKCESGLNPKARNKHSSATGLFQIMAGVHGVRRDWLEDVDVNIKIAKKLYQNSGLNPWISSKKCWSNYDR